MTAAASIDPQKIFELKSFVQLVDSKPEIVHLAPLKFFKDFLIRWGCDVDKHAPEVKTEAKAQEEPAPKVSVELSICQHILILLILITLC